MIRTGNLSLVMVNEFMPVLASSVNELIFLRLSAEKKQLFQWASWKRRKD